MVRIQTQLPIWGCLKALSRSNLGPAISPFQRIWRQTHRPYILHRSVITMVRGSGKKPVESRSCEGPTDVCLSFSGKFKQKRGGGRNFRCGFTMYYYIGF